MYRIMHPLFGIGFRQAHMEEDNYSDDDDDENSWNNANADEEDEATETLN